MNFPVFDLHCDTANALVCANCVEPLELNKNHLHIDLERAGKLPGYAQCFACFSTPVEKGNPIDRFEKEMMTILSELMKNEARIRLAYTAEEVEENLSQGVMSAILTIEGPAGFGFDPELLEDLYNVGFRVTTLGWNEKNPLTGSHITGGGLTDLGREYVKEAQRLGMLVDVSHISDEGFWDIIEITQAPVIATHSNSRSVCNHSRNLTDDMFKAICKTGGLTGINLYPDFLGANASLDTVCDHIFHFLEMDPEGSHIALGGDLDGVESLPVGFSGVQDYSLLAQMLQERGLSDDIIYKIFWKNATEVFKKCCT